MAKDPAFLFYPNDFLSGTQFFSDEQVGKFMRILMAQHQHGHLSEEQVIFICKSYDKHIFSKLKQDSAGLWYNERLKIEMDKRKNYVLSRSKNKEGKTKDKIIPKSYVPHMVNEDEIEIAIVNENIKYAFDEIYLTDQKNFWHKQGIDFDFEYPAFVQKVRGSPEDYKGHDTSGLRKALQAQLRKGKKLQTNGTHKNTPSAAIIDPKRKFTPGF